jgi:hypothetical protein
VISKATAKFWKCYSYLPQDIRRQAKEAYALFQNDPWYPSLRFRRVHSSLPVYSVRVSKDYRAVGILKENRVVWFWIGSHSEYDKLLKQLKST